MPPTTESRSRWSAILFDFDGTLVDSAPAILGAFHAALQECGVSPVIPLEAGLIGPPLAETLSLLAGSSEPLLLARLTQAFKTHYDATCAQRTPAFEGVPALLKTLRTQGIRLFIATNKRDLPTRRILNHLGWEIYFEGVYALDSCTPAKRHKSDLIRHILQHHHLTQDTTLYVGDRREDGAAAEDNHLPFYFAAWSAPAATVRSADLPPRWIRVEHPEASAFMA